MDPASLPSLTEGNVKQAFDKPPPPIGSPEKEPAPPGVSHDDSAPPGVDKPGAKDFGSNVSVKVCEINLAMKVSSFFMGYLVPNFKLLCDRLKV